MVELHAPFQQDWSTQREYAFDSTRLNHVIYRVANFGLAGIANDHHRVFVRLLACRADGVCLWKNLCEDVTVFYDFMMRCPADRSASGKKPAIDVPKAGSNCVPGNLFELLFRDAQDNDQKLSVTSDQDIILCITSMLRSAILLAVIPATATESLDFWC